LAAEPPDPLELGRRVFAQEARFVIGAARLDQLPAPDRVEIAFAGRSNVGKSSLLNALTHRKNLARVSRTPGATQQINIFTLGERCYLADLPGYGYARAAKTAVHSWTRLVHLYLRGRPNLRRLCLLIDSRQGVGEPDRAIMRLLDEAAVAHQLILTKADKLPIAALAEVHKAALAQAGRGACHPLVLVTSAETSAGIAELRAELASLIERS
jgi:GTP-binding protein